MPNHFPFAVRELRSQQNYGVVGPMTLDGDSSEKNSHDKMWNVNKKVLTHDMVHRTHLDIFATYYPPKLLNWFIDTWITAIYKPGISRPVRLHSCLLQTGWLLSESGCVFFVVASGVGVEGEAPHNEGRHAVYPCDVSTR
jgi:hypothetical protein